MSTLSVVHRIAPLTIGYFIIYRLSIGWGYRFTVKRGTVSPWISWGILKKPKESNGSVGVTVSPWISDSIHRLFPQFHSRRFDFWCATAACAALMMKPPSASSRLRCGYTACTFLKFSFALRLKFFTSV